jgi:hypothetical protein
MTDEPIVCIDETKVTGNETHIKTFNTVFRQTTVFSMNILGFLFEKWTELEPNLFFVVN